MRLARLISLVSALAFAGLGIGSPAPGGKRPAGRKPLASSPSRKAAAPFRVGEKLFYQIGWMNLPEAATAELAVEPRRNFYGHPARHFRAVAHTEDPLRMLMIVDDQFDSYCDASTLVTFQYEMYLEEQGKHSVRQFALDHGSPGAERIPAPAGTRDPLAALYRLRTVDWRRTPRLAFPVYDGKHFYQMAAQLAAAHDSVLVPAGHFDASRITIQVFSREAGIAPMQLTLWLANNPSRTPVEVDANVSVGTVKGELMQVE